LGGALMFGIFTCMADVEGGVPPLATFEHRHDAIAHVASESGRDAGAIRSWWRPGRAGVYVACNRGSAARSRGLRGLLIREVEARQESAGELPQRARSLDETHLMCDGDHCRAPWVASECWASEG
jgi:hypothetical protein